MEAKTTTKHVECEVESLTAVGRAIDWLQSNVDENPYSDAANEARSIINDLKTVRQRPGFDELLTLIAQIAKTDQGLQEIKEAKIRMSQPAEKTSKPRHYRDKNDASDF